MTEMMTSNSLVKVKDHPPYTPDLETPVLLNPLARTQLDKLGSYSFPKKLPSERVLDEGNVKVVSTLLDSQRDTAGVGVDQGIPTSFRRSHPLLIGHHHHRTHIFCSFIQSNIRATKLHRC
jgi:fatty acid synthase subunit alpha, fungi type/fatty acid synthase subunit beta, fungi type